MKYVKQFLIILAFTLLGQLLAHVIPLPIPAAIYGFVLLFVALCTGMLKPEHISETANFLVSVMGVFFVGPTINILAYYKVIAPALVPICVITLSSTIVVFAVAGLVTQFLRSRKGEKNG